MKKCFKCLEEKERSEFYKHSAMGDGLLGKCKECAKKDTELRRAEKEKDMAWRISELKRHRLKSSNYRAAGNRFIKNKTSCKKWTESNPIKKSAHRLVARAIRSGRLTRLPCEVCGDVKSQAHHDDYSAPLSVRWLCTKHHGEHHHNERIHNMLESSNKTTT